MLSVYDDVLCERLCSQSGAASLIAVDHCTSTMDLAHQQAALGAAHGTVIVAEQQGAGRGRSGKSWVSERGVGVWTSVLLRQQAGAPAGVLSLRVGLALAASLDAFTSVPIQLKWPNDLYLGQRKLAGVLTEARWRGDMLEWIVVGVGVNVRPSATIPPSASLGDAASRAMVLVAVVRAVLAAGQGAGELSDSELAAYAARDFAAGQRAASPLEGTVLGITSRGGLRVSTAAGEAVAVAGSLVFSNQTVE